MTEEIRKNEMEQKDALLELYEARDTLTRLIVDVARITLVLHLLGHDSDAIEKKITDFLLDVKAGKIEGLDWNKPSVYNYPPYKITYFGNKEFDSKQFREGTAPSNRMIDELFEALYLLEKLKR